MEKVDLMSLEYEALSDYIKTEYKEPAFRANQLFSWLHEKQVSDFSEMTNLSKAFREKLSENCFLTNLSVEDCQISEIDGTRKYLFALEDGNMVETVLMKYKFGNSVCISSQVGCAMGCRFCASTIDGFVRNLTPAEMLGQIYGIMKHTGERVSHVVVMGTGEPLNNLDHLLSFIRILTHEKGYHLSKRNITVSTCGLVPEIKKLAEEDLPITLAISLHSAIAEKRRELMPVARRYSLEELSEAAAYYFEKTHRRITFEYSLILGENDGAEDARALGEFVGPLEGHINLIPVNPIKERNYRQTDKKGISAFRNQLEKYGINVTIRREMGRDIDSACGQLRRRHMERN